MTTDHARQDPTGPDHPGMAPAGASPSRTLGRASDLPGTAGTKRTDDTPAGGVPAPDPSRRARPGEELAGPASGLDLGNDVPSTPDSPH